MIANYASRLSDFLPTQQDLNDVAISPSTSRLLNAFPRLVMWFRLLNDLRRDDETSVLIASAHSKIIEIWILIPLGLLHSSYTALRTVVDICTSYTFYYSHPIEWSAVCEGRASWERRARIIDWHLNYTRSFREINSIFGLVEALSKDYHTLSSYVHGIPVTGLPTLRGIDRTCVSDSNLDTFIDVAETVDYNLSLLLLSTSHQDMASLSQKDFRTIMRDVSRVKLAKAGISLPRS